MSATLEQLLELARLEIAGLKAREMTGAEAYRNLQAERDQWMKTATARGEELRDLLSNAAKLKELHVTEGGMEAHLEQRPEVSAFIAHAFAALVMKSPNYTEMKFEPSLANGTHVTVIVQKRSGKTPHELRAEAEKERDTLRARVAEFERVDAERLNMCEECLKVAEKAETRAEPHPDTARLDLVEEMLRCGCSIVYQPDESDETLRQALDRMKAEADEAGRSPATEAQSTS